MYRLCASCPPKGHVIRCGMLDIRPRSSYCIWWMDKGPKEGRKEYCLYCCLGALLNFSSCAFSSLAARRKLLYWYGGVEEDSLQYSFRLSFVTFVILSYTVLWANCPLFGKSWSRNQKDRLEFLAAGYRHFLCFLLNQGAAAIPFSYNMIPFLYLTVSDTCWCVFCPFRVEILRCVMVRVSRLVLLTSVRRSYDRLWAETLRA